jgi:hypothetical protein
VLSILATTLIVTAGVYAANITSVTTQTINPGDTIGPSWYQAVNDRMNSFGSGGGSNTVGVSIPVNGGLAPLNTVLTNTSSAILQVTAHLDGACVGASIEVDGISRVSGVNDCEGSTVSLQALVPPSSTWKINLNEGTGKISILAYASNQTASSIGFQWYAWETGTWTSTCPSTRTVQCKSFPAGNIVADGSCTSVKPVSTLDCVDDGSNG